MPTNIEITTMQNHAFTKLFLDKKKPFQGPVSQSYKCRRQVLTPILTSLVNFYSLSTATSKLCISKIIIYLLSNF